MIATYDEYLPVPDSDMKLRAKISRHLIKLQFAYKYNKCISVIVGEEVRRLEKTALSNVTFFSFRTSNFHNSK
jgi:hypothetical protein